MKVNLRDIQARLVKRGRDAYENEALVAELLGLDLNDEHDAFLFTEATFDGDTAGDDYVNHKNAWRNRVSSLALRVLPEGTKISVQWTLDGEMIVSVK